MPRRKLSEYRAKVLIHEVIQAPYIGWSVDFTQDVAAQLAAIGEAEKYVLKVDQGVKGRFKKGLVILDVTKENIGPELQKLHERGYESFIVEPQTAHDASQESYLAINFDKTGTHLSYSRSGGVDIESNADTIKTVAVDDATDWAGLAQETGFSTEQLQKIVAVFNEEFMTMLEINPYIVSGAGVAILDLAIEVDDAGSYFAKRWQESDFRQASARHLTAEEQTVRELDAQSPASLKLEMINPDGAIFLLLSGGGASVVVADEVYNLGLGDKLANYGEYSGNPNAEETYIYTQSLLKLLLASKAPKKVLFIGGAVANFTDISNTFTGIIKAIDELADQLTQQGVKVFVRRGGPRQEIGLAKIRKTLEQHNLLGGVHDPSTPLTQVVDEAMEEIR